MSGRPARILISGLSGAALVALTGCGSAVAPTAQNQVAPAVAGEQPPPATAPAARASAAPRELPGLGPRTLAAIPRTTRQVVMVTGASRNSPTSTVVVYRRTAAGWQGGAAWPAHNALDGWTDDHHGGDLRSPVGVFTLSDAGGRLADPGSKLPYDRSSRGFSVGGYGFKGEPLAGSFDYVVAIDYNRATGVSPLDWTRPLGDSKGGGIWFHVDHGGPTHGCVSVAKAHMKELLATLDPALNPVVVMGDAADLRR